MYVCIGVCPSVDSGVPRVQSDSWMLELELQEGEMIPLCGCRQLNSGPLQSVLLTAAVSLQR